ncbi:hypothetical protein [Neobacillus sp. PS3-40]|uniref:hypothetical protein n=1 Tax=Neobacillus sp. PS3-40 TaxID=3070679 RepID=UPI0027E12A48|nr:hypothetical protein [Neobacillus sp. PS3-40]WML44066.1 hypothetical protein RCG20_20160 [Neobacillus sp. PS3-40]
MAGEQLQNQIYIFSVDTAAFYNNLEVSLDKQLMEYKQYKANLAEVIRLLNEIKLTSNKLLQMDTEFESYESEINKLEKKIINLHEKYILFKPSIDEYLIFDKKSHTYIVNKDSLLYRSEQYINNCISQLKEKLDKEAVEYKGRRILRDDALRSSNKISQFESTLTRTLGVKKDKTTTDIIVVRAYRYAIFEQIMNEGFKYGDDVYQYFTSSAGNIRNKKSIWIKSSVYEKVKNKLMCGLSIEDINNKGGMNLNKFSSYTALCNTASTPWKDFDITKAIVVPDFSTIINADVDYIDSDYNINPCNMPVEIPHTDGAGMYLASADEDNKSFQFRMPFFKGLMIGFPIYKFIKKFNGNPIVKDIYGEDHDVMKEGILYIFTASQFKMHRFFDSWKDYQDAFKKYGCEAAKCKEEVEVFDDKPISYQVLQTLNKMTKEELEKISEHTVNTIKSVGNDIEVMMDILGAGKSNENKRGLEKALEIYPNLLNDDYCKEVIKEKRLSLIKSARAGKLLIPGTKRTYIAPDLFAFAEWLFLGIESPNGLLNDGEVSCSLYDDGQRLDALRSPHLFREHCCRTNKVDKVIRDGKEIKISDWFITKNIYTSVKDMISKQLMFDVDGDDSLIVCEPSFVSIAERHMEGIRVLQYELGVATQEKITNANLYSGLTKAYAKNIGEISNEISKIWANKEPDLDSIKRLVYENNACIDYAKSLWYPTRPPEINKQIKKHTGNKVPHFFRFAKGKSKDQVATSSNSVVDLLVSEKIIPNNRIHFEKVIKGFDYKKLMKNPKVKVDENKEIIEVFEKINKLKHWDIKKQLKEKEGSKKSCELAVYKEFRDELLKLGKRELVVDVLIKYLYDIKETKNKQSLWFMFGNDIVRNLQLNIQGIVECIECGEVIEEPKQRQIRCDSCQSDRNKENNRKRQQKHKSK